jgi:hypothetical protein
VRRTGKQAEGGVDGVNASSHGGSIRRVEIRDRLPQARADPNHQDFANLAQRAGIGVSTSP